MQISERQVGGVTIIDLEGRFVLEDGVKPFVDLMNELVRQSRKRILLNFDRVTYLDSAGVGAIAWKFVTARKRDTDVKLLNLHPRTHTVLHTTKLLTVIENYDSEERAIASFINRPNEESNAILT